MTIFLSIYISLEIYFTLLKCSCLNNFTFLVSYISYEISTCSFYFKLYYLHYMNIYVRIARLWFCGL